MTTNASPATTDNKMEVTRWERAAQTRWGSYLTEIEKRFVLRAMDLAGTSGDGLEVGGDGGRWSKMLIDRGWHMTVTDVEPDKIELCRRRLPTADSVLVDVSDTALPVEDESFDLLMCIEVFPVIWRDWFIAEAARVLRPGGIFVAVVHNNRSVRGFLQRMKFKMLGAADFYPIAYGPWRRKIRRQGFGVIHEEGFCWMPFGRESESPLVGPATRLEKILGLRRLARLSPWVAVVARKEKG